MVRSTVIGRFAPAALLLCTAFVLFADPLHEGEELLIQRRYEAAVTSLEGALDEGLSEGEKDRAILLLGRARWLAGDARGAVATYQRLIDELPGSPSLRRARFQQAEALASIGDFRSAAPIYQEEIERLVGLDRREEVAATYLGLADRALAAEKPDRTRAVTFFDLALDLGLSPQKERSIRLRAAEARLAEGNFSDAVQRFAPLAKELGLGEGRLRAMLGLGRARWRLGFRAEARATLRDLIELASESEQAGDAAYEVALTYGVPNPGAAELDRAVAALQELHDDFPDHTQAQVALFLVAQCYQNAGRSEDALRSLRAFLAEGHLGLEQEPLARAMIGDVLSGQGKRPEAISAWREFLQAHPSHRDWERVQRAIVDAEYRMAQVAYEEGVEGFDEARTLFAEFSRSYPIDPRNPDILYVGGAMLTAEENYDLAREAFARCVSKYPRSEAASHAQFMIGEIFESKTFNYDGALEAYRGVTWGSWRAEAQRRIQRLTRKHLSLFTPRTFRTDDQPSFQLTSRNIEEVRVRVYRLDLETYFRSTHTAGQVDRLDIEVIEPDETYQSKVPEYTKYRETGRDIEIPFTEPGAYVVKVDDLELEATTMVLVTDVAMIAKSSRHEFFVFTQNLKENRAETGMSVVLSDGEKVIAEGATDADGVWRYKGPELKSLDRLMVFAVNPSGSGASTLSLSGMGYSQGLTPKCYLFTDRPVYQPGQSVHIKGIVREVADGLYELPASADYRLQVVSASGRMILQRSIEFTEFGTFDADLTLPPEAVLGEWRIRVDQGPQGSESFASSFAVAQYQRPRLRLSADAAKQVVYRGEKIEGVFRLRYFFGEPAVGKTVTYSLTLPDGGQVRREGVTNASGEVEFSFETTEFAEEAMATILAQVAEEGVNTGIAVPVVTTEFTPSLALVRTVYLAGEPFDVTVKLLDRSGKPLARRGTALLLRRERQGRRVTEVQVAEREFSTAAADGEGRVNFSAARGGDYLVRVRAEDRFGTVVTAQTGLQVSGEDDQVKLRLLSDREHYRVGETLRVVVANRASAGLVLRTVQGDGILAYQSQLLPTGESVIEFELQPFHAPNFALDLAMIDGQTLRTASREFRVNRDLQVRVTLPENEVEPGSTVEVQVETTDPQGRPVAAELALAVVDESLLALYPESGPKIGEFFFGALRETAFRTISSCDWSYRGAGRAMSAALLTEELREMEEVLEEAIEGEYLGADRLAGQRGQRGRGGRGARGGRGRAGEVALQDQMQRLSRRPDAPATGAPSREARGPGDKLPQADSPFESVFDEDFYAFGRNQAFGLFSDAENGVDGPRTDFSETGAWVPVLTTAADGKGMVEIDLPDSTTSYALKVRGVTTNTYVGEGSAQLRTVKSLQAGVVLPFALIEGDRAEVTTTAHNLTDEALRVDLTMDVRVGEVENGQQARLSLEGHREGEQTFVLGATDTGDMSVRVGASSGELTDVLVADLPVRPFGVEYRDGHAGHTNGSTSFALGLPVGREYRRLEMLVEIGRDPGHDLVRAALGLGFRPHSSRRLDPTQLALASRGLGSLLVLDHLERVGRSGKADAARLRGLAASALSRLVSSQVENGGFAWVGKRNPDLRATSQVVLFLALAKKRGFDAASEPLDKAAEWLLQNTTRARLVDRARAAWALAAAGGRRMEYSVLNALHRGRSSMSLAGLAYLALAWQDFGRAELAGEVLDVLRGKLDLRGAKNAEQTTTIALSAAALLRLDARDALGAQAITWLTEHQVGVSWGTSEATAAALRALVEAGGREMAAASTSEVQVEINGHHLATVPASVKESNIKFEVPAAWLKDQDNQVRIEVGGRGRVHYSALLNGFARGFTPDDRRPGLRQPNRSYLPAFQRHDGKVLNPGFSVIAGQYQSFRNTLTKLAVGESGRVQISFYLDEMHRDEMTPLVVEEWIPAGCTVLRESVRGNFDHVEVEPNRMVFYFRDGVYSPSINYELHAKIPGRYRVLPTRVYGALRPDLLTHGTDLVFNVLPRGSEDRDPYRMTPDELYALGRQLFDAGELELAGEHLGQLLDEWHRTRWFLRDDYYKEVARMMLFIAVERRDSRSIVRFFEVLREQYSELVIPFDKIVAVGKAYRDIGEFEQSVLVFRAAAESSYLKEAAVSNTLANLGEVRSSVEFLRQLLANYPGLNTMRLSLYSIGQDLAARAAEMPEGVPVDPKVGRRDVLRAAALETLREFLIQYPEDPIAEEVSFAWATTYVEGKDLDRALEVSRDALARYPNSTFTDELLYTVGFAQFAKGQHEDAFATLQRVAQDDFLLPNGVPAPSENKFHAIYLQGQIHHARGEPAKALAAYELVQKHFSDASEASDYFLRKDLSLPEVTTFNLDQEVELKLAYRNIESVEVKVYRVDLMRLYLLRKSLNDISGIQLHGIRPFVELTSNLGDGRDYRTKEKTLSLPLDAAGAYLVVVRGGDYLASGMALLSDLRTEVQEFLDVGRIRVNVKGADGYLSEARIKVIGTGDEEFRSGETDLRGVFVGTGLVGQATVIVKKGDQYAFYRGEGVHQPAQYRPPVQQLEQAREELRGLKESEGKTFEGWGNNLLFNQSNRARQQVWLKQQVLENTQKGVEVRRTNK